jgi:hypothetical protein
MVFALLGAAGESGGELVDVRGKPGAYTVSPSRVVVFDFGQPGREPAE